MSEKLHFGRFDFAAFSLFATYAAVSLAVPIVLVDMARDLGFPLAEGGMATGGSMHMVRSIAMCVSMVFCGFAAARFGNRMTLGIAASLMGLGIFLCSLAPSALLVMPMLLVAGIGEGTIEGLGTPFVQDMHDKDSGRYVNFTHGFWSLGIIVAVLLLGALLDWGFSWRFVLVVTSLFALLPVSLLLLPSRHPYKEKSVGVSAREVSLHAVEIVRTPAFWLYFAAMFLAGGGEYCLTFWCASFIQLNFAGSAFAGAVGTAAFSAGMFLGRTSSGALVPQRHLKTLILSAGCAASVVSLLIPFFALHVDAIPPGLVLPGLCLLLFLTGLGTAPFWPSIQSLCVDHMPRLDTTMVFILLSCAGVPGCGFFTWLMGIVGDRAGLPRSFLLVPASFLVMVGLIALTRKSQPKKNR